MSSVLAALCISSFFDETCNRHAGPFAPLIGARCIKGSIQVAT